MKNQHRVSLLVVMPNLNTGGAERVSVTLLNHIDRARFDVTLAVLGASDGPLFDELPANLKIIAFGKHRARGALWSLIRLIQRGQFDVVFSNLSYVNLLIALVRPILGRHIMLVCRETSIVTLNSRQYRHPWFWNALYRIFYSQIDLVICQSQTMREDLINSGYFPDHRSRIINNPIDIDRVRSLAKAGLGASSIRSCSAANGLQALTEFVYVGGLRPEKQVECLIEALQLQAAFRYCLTIVGDGPERSRLEEEVKQRGVEDRVRFVGFQQNPYPFIARADTLLISSVHEGFPNVALEALCLETPVISTPAGGVMNEIAQKFIGVSVAEEQSSKSLANAIEARATTPARTFDTNGLAEFEAREIAKQYEAIFQSQTL